MALCSPAAQACEPPASHIGRIAEETVPGLLRSNPRGEPDGDARAELDPGGQEIVRGCGAGVVRQGDVAVGELVGAEVLDGLAERRLVLAEALGLGAVMLVDHFLDRDRAGHRGALAEERARRTQRVARDVPERRERGRPYTMLAHQFLEALEVPALLLRHLADNAAGRGLAEHGELAFVDADGAVL